MQDECLAYTITLDPHCILYYLHFMDEETDQRGDSLAQGLTSR